MIAIEDDYEPTFTTILQHRWVHFGKLFQGEPVCATGLIYYKPHGLCSGQ